MTASLTQLGVQVTQIVREPHALRGAAGAARSRRRSHERYREHGVDLRLERDRDPGGADLIVAGIGVEPNVELAPRRRARGAERRRRRRALRDVPARASTRSATSPSSTTPSSGATGGSSTGRTPPTTARRSARSSPARTSATTPSRRSSPSSSAARSSSSATRSATTRPRWRATSPRRRASSASCAAGQAVGGGRRPGRTRRPRTALKEEIRAGAATVRLAVTLAGKRLRRRNACPTRRSNSSRSTRSARCRWMRCRRRSRPSGHRDGARPARLPALPRGDAAQPGEPALAGPRPVHPQRRPRLRPPVLDAPPRRLQPLARGAEALPPVAVGDARATRSSATPKASR